MKYVAISTLWFIKSASFWPKIRHKLTIFCKQYNLRDMFLKSEAAQQIKCTVYRSAKFLKFLVRFDQILYIFCTYSPSPPTGAPPLDPAGKLPSPSVCPPPLVCCFHRHCSQDSNSTMAPRNYICTTLRINLHIWRSFRSPIHPPAGNARMLVQHHAHIAFNCAEASV